MAMRLGVLLLILVFRTSQTIQAAVAAGDAITVAAGKDGIGVESIREYY